MNWSINLTTINTTQAPILNGVKDTDIIAQFCTSWAWWEIGMWGVLLLLITCKIIALRILKKHPDDLTVRMLHSIVDDMTDMSVAFIAVLYFLLLLWRMFA